jgi:carbonic anhydrase
MDFRFKPKVHEFLTGEGLMGDFDDVSLAGAAKNIVSPADDAERELALRQIEISRRLHGMEEVILIHHMDCGAYGGHAAFESLEAERRKQLEDLEESRKIILQRWPDLKVKKVLATIGKGDDTEKIEFEKIE